MEGRKSPQASNGTDWSCDHEIVGPARDRAYLALRAQILSGELAPGTTLLESAVAERLAMSRTPVREALLLLQNENLVDIRPRHGMTVRRPSTSSLVQIYEVYSALEAMACRIVARDGMGAGDAAALQKLMDDMERATRQEDIAGWSRLDDAFHSRIAQASGNLRLQASLRTCWAEQYRARMAIVPFRPLPVRSNQEHRALFVALASGDEFEAARLLQIHRERGDAMAIDLIRTHGLAG